jgi:hypothetical protein
MTKFHLDYDRILQGDFALAKSKGELNLFLVFQVNCPGCFIYGFPLAESLHQKYKSRGLKVLGISTAFEDFDYNTAANVELLLSERKLIGATKRAIGDIYHNQSISFPIASDRLTTGQEVATSDNPIAICRGLGGDESLFEAKLELHRKVAFHLENLHRTSVTFALNFLRGTPSFILCDQNLEILEQWFGHESDAKVFTRIDKYLQSDVAIAKVKNRIQQTLQQIEN